MPHTLLVNSVVRLGVLATLVAICDPASSVAAPSSVSDAKSAVSCLDVLAALKPRLAVLTSGASLVSNAVPRLPPLSRRYFWKTGWQGPEPRPELVAAWYRKIPSSAAACPGFQTILSPGVDVVDEVADAARIKAALLPTLTTSTVVAVSAPAINRAGARAIVLVEWRVNGMGGGDELILLGKQAGSWREVSRRQVSNS